MKYNIWYTSVLTASNNPFSIILEHCHQGIFILDRIPISNDSKCYQSLRYGQDNERTWPVSTHIASLVPPFQQQPTTTSRRLRTQD